MNEFLQSEEWLKFQEANGREVIRLSSDGFSANGIMHELSLVGKYLYLPRGPLFRISNIEYRISNHLQKLIEEAKKRNANWIRIEPQTEEMLEEVRKELETQRLAQGDNLSVVKAPHDVQPREVFVMDIAPNLETLLAQMKPKTRYNIGLAEKRGVRVFVTREEKYRQAFLDLIVATAERKEISPHPQAYYEKMFEVFWADQNSAVIPAQAGIQNDWIPGPSEGGQAIRDDKKILMELFIAEYQGKILAANLLTIYGKRATYLHGGSGDEHRDVMAPYLLQWKQIQYAKERGCTEYDFGGVKTVSNQQSTDNEKQKTNNKSSWGGITRFKIGFSPQTQPVVFPGAYDIVLNNYSYKLYLFLSWLRGMGVKFFRK